LALRRLKHPAILREIGPPAQKNFIGFQCALPGGQATDSSKPVTRLPRKKLSHRQREALLSRLLFCADKRFGGDLLW
jgi:hypothetical protein